MDGFADPNSIGPDGHHRMHEERAARLSPFVSITSATYAARRLFTIELGQHFNLGTAVEQVSDSSTHFLHVFGLAMIIER